MLIDAHVNVDSTQFPVERALRILEQSKIRSAIIFADPRSDNLDTQNEYVLRSAREHDLYPFFYMGGNPFTDTRPDELVLPDNLDEYAGIRWHRWAGEGIDRDGQLDEAELEWAANLMESADFEAFVSAAAHYSLPILFEESFAVTLELVLRYPSLDILIPHMGARSGGQANVVRALWDQPNVYFETSLSLLDETMLARVGPERLIFGSCLPYGDPEVELNKIDRLPVPEDAKEGMYGGNIEHLLSAHLPV